LSNKLGSLSESFGRLTLGGNIYLNGNTVAECLNENRFPGLTLILEEDDYY